MLCCRKALYPFFSPFLKYIRTRSFIVHLVQGRYCWFHTYAGTYNNAGCNLLTAQNTRDKLEIMFLENLISLSVGTQRLNNMVIKWMIDLSEVRACVRSCVICFLYNLRRWSLETVIEILNSYSECNAVSRRGNEMMCGTTFKYYENVNTD